MNHLLTLNNVLSKYLIFIILGFSCIAYIVPEYFTWAIAYTPFLLGIAMFGMGLTIKFESLCSIFRHPKDICIGVLAQYTIMPLLAWGICHIFTLSPDIVIGVILVGCCPGGTASNVITYIANDDVPLSVGMTITSTLIAPHSYTIINLIYRWCMGRCSSSTYDDYYGKSYYCANLIGRSNPICM